MEDLCKCPDCNWVGKEKNTINTYQMYTDDWGRECEEGSPISCPSCNFNFCVSWDLYKINPHYLYSIED
jgi:hypothetical protein